MNLLDFVLKLSLQTFAYASKQRDIFPKQIFCLFVKTKANFLHLTQKCWGQHFNCYYESKLPEQLKSELNQYKQSFIITFNVIRRLRFDLEASWKQDNTKLISGM